MNKNKYYIRLKFWILIFESFRYLTFNLEIMYNTKMRMFTKKFMLINTGIVSMNNKCKCISIDLPIIFLVSKITVS